MITIIFHWITPKGFESPHAKKKILARWSLTCKAFGVTNLICVSKDEMQIKDTEISFTNVRTFDEAFSLVTGNLIFVEQGGTDLDNFKHPEDGVYVFGSDYEGLAKSTISIPSLTPIHAEIAAGIVLQNRYKQWLSQ